MNANEPIIDVTPLKHSRTRSTSSNSSYASSQQRTASAGRPYAANWQHTAPTGNPYGSQQRTTTTKSSFVGQAMQTRLGGFVQMLVGIFLVMVGVPMLILPGPGLLSIIGGLALTASGFRKVTGMPLASWFSMSRYPR